MSLMVKPLLLLIALLVSFKVAAESEFDRVRYFSIWGLGAPPEDLSNRLQGNSVAIELGGKLFFDQGLSANGEVSCASCHVTDGQFIPNESIPAANDRKFRTVMPVIGAAYSRYFFWDGRSDSLWAQALAPLENPSEHNISRHDAVAHVIEHYRPLLALLPDPEGRISRDIDALKGLVGTHEPATSEAINRLFVIIGKSIAAFEASLEMQPSEWDNVAQKILQHQALSPKEQHIYSGFKVFDSDQTRCSTCHTGPLMSDYAFHNTAMPVNEKLGIEAGLYGILPKLASNEFGCLSIYSDAVKEDCYHVTFIAKDPHVAFGAFKTPSLRAVDKRLSFGHAGQFSTLEQVLEHYQSAPMGNHGRLFGKASFSELKAFQLTDVEKQQLLAFLGAL